jgi:hypothetical protein
MSERSFQEDFFQEKKSDSSKMAQYLSDVTHLWASDVFSEEF